MVQFTSSPQFMGERFASTPLMRTVGYTLTVVIVLCNLVLAYMQVWFYGKMSLKSKRSVFFLMFFGFYKVFPIDIICTLLFFFSLSLLAAGGLSRY